MNIYKTSKLFLLAGGMLLATACEKDLLDKTNPNAPSTGVFWKTSDDAVKGVNATYAALQLPGTYSRWIFFALDLRSDEGYSQSPWTDLANFTRFVQNNYNFEPSESIWTDHYRGIFRANQVLASVPNITMDENLKKRLMGEAQFLRGLYYFNLASLYGNVPLALEPSTATSRPPQATTAQVWEQVIKDLQAAKAVLPPSYTGADIGRATKGAAAALLGKTYMQLRQWEAAERELGEVISSNLYGLVPNYLDNFTMTNENNQESVFEVQFSDALQGDGQDRPGASEGNNRAQFFGPRGIGWSDGQPRRWLFEEYMTETDKNGEPDPRRDVTLLHSDMMVYGQTYAQRGYNDPNELFWRKYQNDRTRTFENYHSGINIRVIRYADVLLLYAEALNELNRTTEAYSYINMVRTRSNMKTLEEAGKAGLSQEQMRMQLMHERAVELAGESVRWNDIQRWQLTETPQGIALLRAHDPDFENYQPNKSELLPLPQTDVDISKLTQNPNW